MLETLLLLVSVGLMLHLIPGFNNLRVLDAIRIGPENAPFTMYYNFDKALVPFVLLICLKTLFTTDTRPHTEPWYWLVLIVAVPALLMMAVTLNGLKVELHHPEWLLQFTLANIFFVSLAEEALFRGYIQQRLSSVMHPAMALIIVSLLFGACIMRGVVCWSSLPR
jgi:uncharacterized protein